MTEAVDTTTGELVVLEPGGIARYEGAGGLEQARVIARELDHFVKERKLAVKIGKGEHLKVEAWLSLGMMVGVTPRTEWVKEVEIGGEHGFHARVEVVDQAGMVRGAAEAYCTNGETMGGRARWSDLHAMASMAQTRATSKALGQVLRWIPELAGYSGTPAEEMPPSEPKQRKQKTAPPPPLPPDPVEQAIEVLEPETVVEEKLGPQGAQTGVAEFGERIAVEDGISEKQAKLLLVKTGQAAKRTGIAPARVVLNAVLRSRGYQPIPMNAEGDEILLMLCETISWKHKGNLGDQGDQKMMDCLIHDLETFEPDADF